ncbi:MAG: hypothetical protein ABUK01_14715 [Leptospirales bacterium]
MKPSREEVDSYGNYRKAMVGLIAGHTYTIIIKVDVNGNRVDDTTDVGQIITGIVTENTIHFNNLQVLSTLSAVVDSSILNKMAAGLISKSAFLAIDLSKIQNIGFADSVGVLYDDTGKATITAEAYLLPRKLR